MNATLWRTHSHVLQGCSGPHSLAPLHHATRYPVAQHRPYWSRPAQGLHQLHKSLPCCAKPQHHSDGGHNHDDLHQPHHHQHQDPEPSGPIQLHPLIQKALTVLLAAIISFSLSCSCSAAFAYSKPPPSYFSSPSPALVISASPTSASIITSSQQLPRSSSSYSTPVDPTLHFTLYPQHHQDSLYDTSSELEDNLLGAFRQVEARMGSALGKLTSGIQQLDEAAQQELQNQAETVINEVWELVDAFYLDVRNTGFDHGRWEQLRDQALAQQYSDKGAVYGAVRSMLAKGVADPYSRLITPPEFESMKKYDITGVGLNLGTAEEFVKKTGKPLPAGHDVSEGGVWVVGFSQGSPADVAGIRQGDQILAVDGQSLSDLSPFQAASLIAGADEEAPQPAKGPTVELSVCKPDGQQLRYSIQRPAGQPIPSPVTYRADSQAGGKARLGVIKLSSFNARAQRDVSAAIRALDAQGVEGFVLDLRDNRGGLVSEGLEVARLFLGDGAPIVFTQSRAMSADVPRAHGPALSGKPLIVLVDDHTASASEIVAGALKDNCRAVLVGKQTYGKGLIQSVYELSDGSGLVITVGRYLTPAKVDIDREGIRPNFRSMPTADQLERELEVCRVGRK